MRTASKLTFFKRITTCLKTLTSQKKIVITNKCIILVIILDTLEGAQMQGATLHLSYLYFLFMSNALLQNGRCWITKHSLSKVTLGAAAHPPPSTSPWKQDDFKMLLCTNRVKIMQLCWPKSWKSTLDLEYRHLVIELDSNFIIMAIIMILFFSQAIKQPSNH